MMTDEDLERLGELARRTEDIRVADGFTDAVMAAIQTEAAPVSAPRLVEGVTRSGAVALTLAAMAAAACIMLSIDAQSSFDEEVLVSVDIVEVSE